MLDDVKITLKSHFIANCHYVRNGVMDIYTEQQKKRIFCTFCKVYKLEIKY